MAEAYIRFVTHICRSSHVIKNPKSSSTKIKIDTISRLSVHDMSTDKNINCIFEGPRYFSLLTVAF